MQSDNLIFADSGYETENVFPMFGLWTSGTWPRTAKMRTGPKSAGDAKLQ